MAREDNTIYYGEGEKIILSGDFLQFHKFNPKLKVWYFVDDVFVGELYQAWRDHLVVDGKLEIKE